MAEELIVAYIIVYKLIRVNFINVHFYFSMKILAAATTFECILPGCVQATIFAMRV